MPGRASSELELLKAALIGFQTQIAEIERKMMVIRQQLAAAGGGRMPTAPTSDSGSTGPTPLRKKRRLSAAGRKRIIEATKKRWAKVRAAKLARSGKKSAGAKTAARGNRRTRKKVTAQKPQLSPSPATPLGQASEEPRP